MVSPDKVLGDIDKALANSRATTAQAGKRCTSICARPNFPEAPPPPIRIVPPSLKPGQPDGIAVIGVRKVPGKTVETQRPPVPVGTPTTAYVAYVRRKPCFADAPGNMVDRP
jgi:hypothetical protein